ncbi:MAG: LptA/OstA family protein, partial [Gammaproteobacteria bacterium]|nr:LptA/OstA family protein [Gammaproteobacteria bacterium]
MKNINFVVFYLLVAIAPVTFALTTDKDQPIEIEADAAELDDRKNVTVYTGNVIVTQGSIRMTGEKMTVYYTDDN